jgi:hypothetical protein
VTPEETRAAWRSLAWTIAVVILAIVAALVLAGCATTATRPAGPREVVSGVAQPACAFLCWLTITVTDSEGAKVNGAESVSIVKPISTSTEVSGGVEVKPPPK